MTDNNDNIVELLDENDNPVKFEFIHAMTYEDTDYVVLVPADDEDDGNEETGVVILRVALDDDGDESYENVEDDKLLETLFELFVAEMEALEDGDDE